jgi:hypothetical protein
MPRQPPDDAEISNIYIDETSQTKHRYLVLGGMIMPKVGCGEFEEAFRHARLPELPHGEMKWTKVSRSKLPAYQRVVDLFFDRASVETHPHFHSLVVDTLKIDDATYNEGDREAGFNKEVYQLLLKIRRLYREPLFHVYPDYRSTPSSTEELRLIVNRGSAKKGDLRDWPFRRIHFRDSKDEAFLQIVDILIGALAFPLNGHDKAINASQAKCALSDHVIRRAPILDVFRDTTVRGWFTIWHRRLR